MDRGEFAVRGGILDVFPPTAPHPVRIEFFGDEIDTIKEFHASDQRTYGDGLKTIWATACRELQLTDAVRTRAKALVGSIPNAEDMLESIANAIPVEGMESLMPALVDHLEPVGSMLPKHAVILLSDPEKLRRSAEDLAKTANEFLAASWHVAASGHGAGAPISFDEASFLDYAETISSLEYSEHPVIRLTSFGVDTTLTGHVQLDAQNPAEFRGDEAKASQGIEGLLDAGFHVTITAAAAGTLARLKRAINTTGIANFDVIRSQAIDGFVDKAAKIALLTERDLTGRTSAVAVAKTPKRRRKAIDLVELKKAITWCTSSTALAGSSKCVSASSAPAPTKPLANTWSSNMRLPSAAPRRTNCSSPPTSSTRSANTSAPKPPSSTSSAAPTGRPPRPRPASTSTRSPTT